MGLPLRSYMSIQGLETRPALYKNTSFQGKTKIKADTKLIVVMCCQIFDGMSVVQSSGNFLRQPVPRYGCA